MTCFKSRHGLPLILIAASLCATARAADQVDNPKYTSWSHFKEGSTSTLSADSKMMGQEVHIEVMKKLISVTTDAVVIETTTKVTLMGQDKEQPPVKETINAKTDKVDYVARDDQDVSAMGKSFKCKVYDVTTPISTSRPAMAAAAGLGTKSVSTVYINDQVPGGIVKLDSTSGTHSMTLTLSAMESK